MKYERLQRNMSGSSPKAFSIGEQRIGLNESTYFIADIAANHDGDLLRAKDLIHAAAAAGADAAKFQHFQAATIVSQVGFDYLGEGTVTHQSSWKKPVSEVYEDASVKLAWSESLRSACDDAGIAFFTTPYSFELADAMDDFVPAFKIGSGDITWIELIEHIARKGKPYILATGASTFNDVVRAVEACTLINQDFCLMQCNTNYTGNLENLRYVNLNVLKTYGEMFPGVLLGLSDHTPGHATVLGAITLGARMIEKHFTDDTSRSGPDHKFSMDPSSWSEMILRSRELESALGGGVKKIEPNESATSIVQRRSIRARRNLEVGTTLTREDLEVLRPSPEGSLSPYEINLVLGQKLGTRMRLGDHLTWKHLK
jgi:N-acetylneuraminate synthase